MTARIAYQPEIDGLRTVAVLSVVLFHARFRFFDGGFVGVDIFFVISGFLITRIIVNDVKEGRFEYASFYLRRARRLFPALLTIIALTFFVSLFILMPTDLEKFSRSVVASLFWCSNFFFWNEAGYFDNTAYAKPLLHTWSLSVEEQFYLFWPSMLVLASRFTSSRVQVLGVVILISLVSFCVGLLQIHHDPYSAFFMPFSRIAEFGVGAALVWTDKKRIQDNRVNELLLISGLSMIAVSVVMFDEDTLFPGFPSLLPCIGAALCIYSGQAKYSGLLLRNRLAVYIGLISYSLYLVHWPVIVFINYQSMEYTVLLQIFSVILSILLAIALNKHVESKFRKPSKEKALGVKLYATSVLVAISLIVIPAIYVIFSKGWEGRWSMPPPIMMGADSIESRRIDSLKYVNDPGVNNRDAFEREAKIRVVIIGDSHAKDLFNAIYLNRDKLSEFSFRHLKLDDNCYALFKERVHVKLPPSARKECESDMAMLSENKAIAMSDWILVAPRWKNSSVISVVGLFDYLKENYSAKVGVVGRTAEFKNVPKLFRLKGNLDGAEEYLASHRNTEIDVINDLLLGIAKENEVLYLDKVSAICADDYRECEVLDAGGNIIYFDYGHWTLEGARYIGGRLIERGFFEPLKQKTSQSGA